MLTTSDIQALINDLKAAKEKLEATQINKLSNSQLVLLIKNIATIKGKIIAFNQILTSIQTKNSQRGI